MRYALISLLASLLATSAFAAGKVRPQSPVAFTASIATARAACLHGLNQARADTEADAGATFIWRVTNGVITSGDRTRAITFAPTGPGAVALALTVQWQGTTIATQTVVPVFDGPEILSQPQSTSVPAGGSATLKVAASDDALSYDWYEGPAGDTSRLVLAGAAQLTTPPLTRSTSYWVRVSNDCGATASQTAVVLVGGKRRAAR